MAKQSAGLLVYRVKGRRTEVLLVHPGGPFWARKDKGAWSLPKGEIDEGEDLLAAAKREFKEETGLEPPAGDYKEIGTAKNKSGKVIHGWAVDGNPDVLSFKSNTFTMEWPPKSGQQQDFPEVDKAEWFSLEQAKTKLNPAQIEFINRLAKMSGEQIDEPPEQASLF